MDWWDAVIAYYWVVGFIFVGLLIWICSTLVRRAFLRRKLDRLDTPRGAE